MCDCDGAEDRPYRCEQHSDLIKEMHNFLLGIDDIPVTTIVVDR